VVARTRIAKLQAELIPEASHDLTFGQAARVNELVTQFLTG
jgi:hypothetical protein